MILPGKTKSTLDEAHVFCDYTRAYPEIDSIIILSSSFHTRRTSLIFKTVFRKSGEDVVIQVSPSPYSEYTPQKW
jgi:uncharacterized SAM-binding protein YcdF (DUF218 family)